MSINRVVVSGNLTRDPELRTSPSGNNVLSFGIAVNDRRRNPSTGEWENYANFFDCTVFGARADGLSGILTKGMKIALAGRLHYSSWEKDGQKRNKIEIYVDDVEFMSSRGGGESLDSGSGGGYNAGSYNNKPSVDIPPAPEITVYDEDIPF